MLNCQMLTMIFDNSFIPNIKDIITVGALYRLYVEPRRTSSQPYRENAPKSRNRGFI